MKNKKILGVFGNVAFYGQERGNLQVFELLQDAGFEMLLAVNDLGFQWHIQSEVEARNLAYKKIRFSWDLRKTLDLKVLKGYIVNIPSSNYQLYKLIKYYKPDYIHVCNDTHVMILLPVLLLNKTKLIYRLGDKPSSYLSAFHHYLWKRFIIPRVNSFVCISNYIKQELTKLDCPEDKITVIYNFPPKRIKLLDDDLPKRNNDYIT
ncbi:MAG: glycosyltransferase, partial [Gelidibacter sp.]